MGALIIAEHNNKELKSTTLNAISASQNINLDLHVKVLKKWSQNNKHLISLGYK